MSNEDRDYDLRVREIALHEAVVRADGINGPVSTVDLAIEFEKYLRGHLIPTRR